MQITLKEHEIAIAVKDYLTKQGINLANKSVNVKFTATRSNGGGILADIDVEELGVEIPGYTDSVGDAVDGAVEDARPALVAVPTDTKEKPAAEPAAAETKTSTRSVKAIAAAARDAELPEDIQPAAPAAAEAAKPEASQATGASVGSLFA